jgi:hypothetical protein
MTTTTFKGGCHCGALRVTFASELPAADLPVRECQCTFCRHHGARNTSDPQGRVHIVAEAAALVRYRFGLRTADFFVCNRCGVYIACVLDDAFASVNTRVLDGDWEHRPATPRDFEGETVEARIRRRRVTWSPVVVEVVC